MTLTQATKVPLETKKKTYKGYLNPSRGRRFGEDWHVVSTQYAKLLICLNKKSTCDVIKNCVVEFEEHLSKSKEIRVPYNHPLLKLDHNQMVCLGRQVNEIRTAHYNNIGQGSVSKTALADARRLLGCKQLCTIVT
jgi:hypothetical protein